MTRSWTWVDPAFAVDAAGHHHVAVGRIGTEPGVWYGTDAGGAWSMERLTTDARPTAASGSWSRRTAPRRSPTGSRARRAAWLATGTPGDWTFTKIADEADHRHPRDRAGGERVAPPRVRRRRRRRAADRLRHERRRRLVGDADRRQLADHAGCEPVDRPRRRGPRPRRVRDRWARRPTAPRSSTRPTAPAPGSLSQRTTGAPRDLDPSDRRRCRGPPADRVPAGGLRRPAPVVQRLVVDVEDRELWGRTTPTRRSPSTPPATRTCCSRRAALHYEACDAAAVLGAPGPPLVDRRARRRSGPPGDRLRRRREPVARARPRRQPLGRVREHAVAPRRDPPDPAARAR